MKRYFITILIATFALQACKKSGMDLPATSSLLAINAAVNMPSLRVGVADKPVTWSLTGSSNTILFTRSFQVGAPAGSYNIKAVATADTNQVIYSSPKAEEFKANEFNTLFICGNTGAYEGIFINNDNIVNYTDSVMGIRFINLSPNSSPLNITLATSPTTNEASGVAYKQKTDFKTYPALASAPQMDFQLRNASGTLLATYSLKQTTTSPYTTVSIPFARFKNITLVIKGLQGTTSGTNAFGIFPVPHY